MSRKLTVKEVQTSFANKGWKLISKTYEGSQKKLGVVCPCGHETTITWNNFQRGQGCGVCACNQKFTYQEVKEYFTLQNCELLSSEYINSVQTLEYRCSCGELSKVSFGEFRQGRRCWNCRGDKISKSLTKDLPKVAMLELCNKSGCKFIDAYRENGRIFLKFNCSCGKECSASWTNFQKVQHCKNCGIKTISGSKCHLWNTNRDQVALNKSLQKKCWNLVGRVLSEFGESKNTTKEAILGYLVSDLSEKIKQHPLYNPDIEFSVDHVFSINLFVKRNIKDMKIINHLNNLRPLHISLNSLRRNRCYEEALDQWLENTDRPAEEVVAEVLMRDFESHNIDAVLMLPELSQDKDRYYKQCLSLKNEGKQKIFVYPHEWAFRKQQIISRCNTIHGEGDSVGARKCEVKIVDKTTLRAFCQQFHFQGSNRLSKIGFGLFHNNMLLGILSLGQHHRGEDVLVLDRLCFRSEQHIPGGSERLLRMAKEWTKTKGYTKIVTFSDRRYTNGNVYERLGFEPIVSYGPDYSYVLKTDAVTHFSKQSQIKKSVHCPSILTELEWAKQRGLQRIWDCGKIRWEISV